MGADPPSTPEPAEQPGDHGVELLPLEDLVVENGNAAPSAVTLAHEEGDALASLYQGTNEPMSDAVPPPPAAATTHCSTRGPRVGFSRGLSERPARYRDRAKVQLVQLVDGPPGVPKSTSVLEVKRLLRVRAKITSWKRL